ncbi:MAG: hypothetical protein WB786_01230 [Thermoplasmata archaeon]
MVPKGEASPVGSELGWTETVQETQKRLSHAKSEVDVSILPIALGALGFGSIVSGLFLFPFLVAFGGGYFELLDLLLPVVFLVALVVPIYRSARRWIGPYQSLLDTYVRELSRLEAEFFWKFAGVPVPP